MTDPFAPSPGPRIKPVELPGFPKPIDLCQPSAEGTCTLTMGRSEDNDLALTGDNFPSVSAYHARFEYSEDVLRVFDLDSRNGVLVNGRAIDGDARLKLGDQVRLGSVGPRFIIVGGRGVSDTVFVRNEDVLGERGRRVEDIVKRGTRANFLRVLVLLVALLGAALWYLNENAKRRGANYEGQLREASLQITQLQEREAEDGQLRAAQELHFQGVERDLQARTKELEANLEGRIADEQRLIKRIDELESNGASKDVLDRVERELAATREELGTARGELVEAQRKVDMLDPVNLAQARLTGVQTVRRSIVLVENRMRILRKSTGKYMHVEGLGLMASPNFEDKGEELALESTGSGFCVDGAGWIITNAHVIEEPESKALRILVEDTDLEPVQDIAVVFSDTGERHTARVETVAKNGVDLALVKIEPFEGMPHLDGFATNVEPPMAGSDIYLFGFPLGHLAVQEGETVIASTFRGILSRNVNGQMQVDAGVHPGNSGGPITDDKGRVVGVVVSVQALPDRTAVYTIGYGVPISDAAFVWPPNSAEETNK